MSDTKPAAEQTASRRLQWRMIAVLTAVWVLLWGDLSFANVVSGIALGVLVTMVFPLPPIDFHGRYRPLAHLRLLGTLLADLVRASITVAGQAFRLRPMEHAVVRVGLRSRSDLYLTLTSELVSLVPGSLVIEVRRADSTVYVHVMDVRGPADLDRTRKEVLAAEALVLRAFGSDSDVASLRSDDEGTPT